MAKRKAVKTEDDFLEMENEGEDETFADAEGTPGNAHAKKLAKASSKAKLTEEPRAHFYTMKGAEKVVKIVVKHRGAFEIYVGNLRRHGANLKGLIAVWKKDGEWFEPHQREEKIAELRESLAAAKKR